MKKYALPLFFLFLMVWQYACGTSATPAPAPAADATDTPIVLPTPNPLNAEYAAMWKPEEILLDGAPNTFWEFKERTNVLLVIRETIDAGDPYRDMLLITQEMVNVNIQQYDGRPTKLSYQFFEGKTAKEVGDIGNAVRILLLDGSTYQYAISIRPTEVDWHDWIIGRNVPPYMSWSVQGRELASYIQRVQIQDWTDQSNLDEFMSNNNPGYVVIRCAAPYQDETYVYLKQENRPFAKGPYCDPESADGFYFVNNSDSAVLETHGLLLQMYWEIQNTDFGADKVIYLSTWDDVFGYAHISWLEPATTSPIFPGATATAIVPYSVP